MISLIVFTDKVNRNDLQAPTLTGLPRIYHGFGPPSCTSPWQPTSHVVYLNNRPSEYRTQKFQTFRAIRYLCARFLTLPSFRKRKSCTRSSKVPATRVLGSGTYESTRTWCRFNWTKFSSLSSPKNLSRLSRAWTPRRKKSTCKFFFLLNSSGNMSQNNKFLHVSSNSADSRQYTVIPKA